MSNSFAIPFDEDGKDKSVWFLGHDYLENMYGTATKFFHFSVLSISSPKGAVALLKKAAFRLSIA